MALRDEELIPLLIEGDEAAGRELFGRHVERLQRRIHARLSLAVRTEYSISDVLQDAFAGAWQALGRFEDRGEGSFGHWLTRIVDNKTNSVLRKHYRRSRQPLRGIPESIIQAADQPTPSAQAMNSELAVRLAACIGELPPLQREAARLVIGKGLSNPEAGQRLGLSADAVRLRVERARESLSKCVVRGL